MGRQTTRAGELEETTGGGNKDCDEANPSMENQGRGLGASLKYLAHLVCSRGRKKRRSFRIYRVEGERKEVRCQERGGRGGMPVETRTQE